MDKLQFDRYYFMGTHSRCALGHWLFKLAEFYSSLNATTYSKHEWPVFKDALYKMLCLAIKTNVNIIYSFSIYSKINDHILSWHYEPNALLILSIY